MRSPTGSAAAGAGAVCEVASGTGATGDCGGSGTAASGAACCGAGTAAGVVAAVRAGTVRGGSKDAGFWAVWQEEADRATTASTAIRNWSFATRIFLYEIRIAPGVNVR